MQVTTYTILEILKYTIPGLVVLYATYLIVNKFLVSDIERKRLAIFSDNIKITVPIRLQAYERIAMLLERMHPHSMINRYYVSGATVTELQQALTQSIRSEFEYNLSQQIYVSKELWETIKTVKEQEITMLNNIAGQLQTTAPAIDYVKKINDYISHEDTVFPTEVALEILHDEAKRILFN